MDDPTQPITLSTIITQISIDLWTSESIVDRLDSLLSGLKATTESSTPVSTQTGMLADAQFILDRVQSMKHNLARIENMLCPNPTLGATTA